MKLNRDGNWAPKDMPIWSISLKRPLHGYGQGDIVQVVESLHPSFTNHWQVFRRESLFIKKEFAKLMV